MRFLLGLSLIAVVLWTGCGQKKQTAEQSGTATESAFTEVIDHGQGVLALPGLGPRALRLQQEGGGEKLGVSLAFPSVINERHEQERVAGFDVVLDQRLAVVSQVAASFGGHHYHTMVQPPAVLSVTQRKIFEKDALAMVFDEEAMPRVVGQPKITIGSKLQN